jgi:ElaB/YqjD/DUF883 family membrane-anchored ribosome-binding protein
MKTNGHGNEVESVVKEGERMVARVAAMAHHAVDKAADVAAPTAEWLTGRAEELDARQKKLTADACSYVTANPLKAVGIALLAGVVLGRILL